YPGRGRPPVRGDCDAQDFRQAFRLHGPVLHPSSPGTAHRASPGHGRLGLFLLTSALFDHRYIPAPPGTGKPALPGSGNVREKVLIVLHGLGDSLQGFTWMPSQLGLDGLSYLLVNAPDDYYGGFSWFDFTGGGAHMENAVPGILRSRKLIKGLVAEVMAQGVASRDILLFGFSQGCLMALDAGLRSEVRLGGICGVSGW